MDFFGVLGEGRRAVRLVAAGKPKMVGVVAIARRLLVTTGALVRHKREFDPEWKSKLLAAPTGQTTGDEADILVAHAR